MMRLIKTELIRIRTRRMTWIVALVAVLYLGLLAYGNVQVFSPLSAAEQQAAQAQYQNAKADWEANKEQAIASCKASAPPDVKCDDMGPKPEHFGKPIPTVPTVWRNLLEGAGLFLGVLALLLGASYVAAEHTSGSISTWLTFEPRRTRVYVAKVVATAASALVAGAAATLLLAGIAIGITVAFGGPVDAAAAVRDIAPGAGRLTAYVALVALGGTAGAFILRHTAAVLGAVLGYAIIEQIVGNWLNDRARFTLFNNVMAFLNDGWDFTWWKCGQNAEARYNCTQMVEHIDMWPAAAFLGAVVAIALIIGWALFRRRDVV